MSTSKKSSSERVKAILEILNLITRLIDWLLRLLGVLAVGGALYLGLPTTLPTLMLRPPAMGQVFSLALRVGFDVLEVLPDGRSVTRTSNPYRLAIDESAATLPRRSIEWNATPECFPGPGPFTSTMPEVSIGEAAEGCEVRLTYGAIEYGPWSP